MSAVTRLRALLALSGVVVGSLAVALRVAPCWTLGIPCLAAIGLAVGLAVELERATAAGGGGGDARARACRRGTGVCQGYDVKC